MVRLIALAALTLVLATTPARAEDDRRSEAQRQFEGGMAHFHLEEYDQAIEAWQEGYRIKPAPQFLYNIAQAYRLSRRPEKALTFYKKGWFWGVGAGGAVLVAGAVTLGVVLGTRGASENTLPAARFN